MPDTKIVLITPPPINIQSANDGDRGNKTVEDFNEAKKKWPGYRTYMSKKRYAERIMQIASEYEETGRVTGLNCWGSLTEARLQDVGEEYDEDRLPGCGLYGVTDFGKGYFTDGLHLDKKGYKLLSKTLYEKMMAKWPQLAPELL